MTSGPGESRAPEADQARGSRERALEALSDAVAVFQPGPDGEYGPVRFTHRVECVHRQAKHVKSAGGRLQVLELRDLARNFLRHVSLQPLSDRQLDAETGDLPPAA